jgi:tetratricopeptide (TPR) repeat protein
MLKTSQTAQIETLIDEQVSCLSGKEATAMDSGLISMTFEDYDAALACFNKVIDEGSNTGPELANALLIRGMLFRHQGETEQALEDLKHAVQVQPDFEPAWNNIAYILNSIKRYYDGLDASDSAIKYSEANAEAWNNRAHALTGLGHLEEALASLDTALYYKPDFANAMYNRGTVLLNLGRYAEAEECIDDALIFDHTIGKAWLYKAMLVAERDPARCIQSLDSAIFYGQADFRTWALKASMLRRSGQTEESLPCYDSALSYERGNYMVWAERGLALDEIGRDEEALASYDSAIAYKQDCYQAWLNRASCLMDMNRLEDALATCDSTLKYIPGFTPAIELRKEIVTMMESK